MSSIAFVGWSPAQLSARGNIVAAPRLVECEVEAFEDGVLRTLQGAVVGDRALETLDPSATAAIFEGTEIEFCLYALEASRSVRRRWVDAGYAEKFANGDLGERVRDWDRRSSSQARVLHRPCPSPTTWMSDFDLDEEIFEMLTLIQELPACRTALWAEALGMDRHRLRRACLSALEMSPEEVIWRWFEYGTRVLRRRDGATLDEVAVIYGYSNGGSVYRAFQRRGREVPERRAVASRA